MNAQLVSLMERDTELIKDMAKQIAERDERIKQLENLNRILAKRIDEMEAEKK